MPYSFIALAVVLVVLVRFLMEATVSLRTKGLVTVVFIISLVMQFGFSQWQIGALLLQCSLGIGMVIYLKLGRSANLRKLGGQ